MCSMFKQEEEMARGMFQCSQWSSKSREESLCVEDEWFDTPTVQTLINSEDDTI